jgi:hypothetical protein
MESKEIRNILRHLFPENYLCLLIRSHLVKSLLHAILQ